MAMVPREHRRRWMLFPALDMLHGALEAGAAGAVYLLVRVLQNPQSVFAVPVVNRFSGWFTGMDDQRIVLRVALVVAAYFLVKNAVLLVTQHARFLIQAQTEAALARTLFRGYLLLPYPFHFRRHSAELSQNITSSVGLAVHALQSFDQLLRRGVIAIGIFATLLIADWSTTLVSGLLLVVLVYVLLRVTRGLVKRGSEEKLQIVRSAQKTVHNALGGIKEIKALGREQYFISAFHDVQQRGVQIGQMALTLGVIPQLVFETTFVLVALAVAVMLRQQAGASPDALPVMGLFGYAGFRLITMANPIVLRINEIHASRPAVDALHADLMLMQEKDGSLAHQSDHEDELALRSELRVDGASYTYPGATQPAMHDASFVLPAGHSMGIVGHTGAGKSTLVDLVVGLLTPSSGAILADGVDVTQRQDRWRRRVGYVPQDVFLVDETLRRNIALGIEEMDVDDAAVLRALQMARLEELVASWPEGIQTSLGERGIRLSGGERQRVGIARALYHNPDLIVFDEATSALDNITEAEVNQSIASLRGRKSLLVIAHRLSTVRACDQLLYLEQGRIVARGTYDELLAANARFRQMAGEEAQAPQAS